MIKDTAIRDQPAVAWGPLKILSRAFQENGSLMESHMRRGIAMAWIRHLETR